MSLMQTKRRVVVTGASGFIGTNLASLLSSHFQIFPLYHANKPALAMDSISLDLTNAKATLETIVSLKPDAVIHLAGNKDLKFCQNSYEAAYQLNVKATENIARASKQSGAGFIFLSSDYVFSGTSGNYKETDLLKPSTKYGEMKKISEEFIASELEKYAIIRTGAVYGARATLLGWILNNLRSDKKIEMFTDAFFTPTYVGDLAKAIGILIESDWHSNTSSLRNFKQGIYHVAGSEKVSRYIFAKTVADVFSLPQELILEDRLEGKGLLLAKDSSLNSESTFQKLGFRCDRLKEGLSKIRPDFK